MSAGRKGMKPMNNSPNSGMKMVWLEFRFVSSLLESHSKEPFVSAV
jgi:hypothetical protein